MTESIVPLSQSELWVPPLGAEGALNHLSSLTQEMAAEWDRVTDAITRDAESSELPPTQIDVARSLFNTLRSKHSTTAAHSARVVLGCAQWADALGLGQSERESLELAALLHDIGKIGVPDKILLKPDKLTQAEADLMKRCRQMGLELVRRSLTLPGVVELVEHVQNWYDGREGNAVGRDIPKGARMLSIMDAFDAMTTEQTYRAALPMGNAIDELHRNSGTQFDPELVRIFAEWRECDPNRLKLEAAQWLRHLGAGDLPQAFEQATVSVGIDSGLFQQHLLNTLNAAVVFINESGRITYWNPAAERLTGLAGASLLQRRWEPGIIGLRTTDGYVVRHAQCPLIGALSNRETHAGRYVLRGPNRQPLLVEVQATPVLGRDGSPQGATLLMQDASPAAHLESRCRSLNAALTRDPLTQVANRAEFDRVIERTVKAHQESGQPCSLLMCDIDHFKSVNDSFGHQAGDEVIKAFASVLDRHSREGDHVARYGGEEFVVLYANCNLKTAGERAEELRKAFYAISHPQVERPVSASFGAAELQNEDSPASLVRRADAALYCAKDQGRNRVVALGAGARPEALGGQEKADPTLLAEQRLQTTTPLPLVVEKLRGFVDEKSLEVLTAQNNVVELRAHGSRFSLLRRKGDGTVTLRVRIELADLQPEHARAPIGTQMRVAIYAQNQRDRRRAAALDQANQMLVNLRAFLMVVPCE